MNETRYLLLRQEAWDLFEIPEPRLLPPVTIKPPTGCVGFCMVFDSLEAALEWGGERARVLPIKGQTEPADA